MHHIQAKQNSQKPYLQSKFNHLQWYCAIDDSVVYRIILIIETWTKHFLDRSIHRSSSIKTLLLEILQYSQETPIRVFLCEHCEIF